MRSFRLALAAAAVAGVVVPLTAEAAIPPPYQCHVEKTAVAQFTYNVPVVGGQYVYTYRVVCYG